MNEGSVGFSASTVMVLLGSISLATTGQLLLRAGMTRIGVIELTGTSLTDLIRGALSTWQVLVGLGAFGVSALLWLITLSRVPLSTAYPVVSLSYALILGFSYWVLGERPAPLVWVGVLFIMSGISLIGLGQR